MAVIEGNETQAETPSDPATNKPDGDEEIIDENLLICSGKRILDEEKQNVIFEILKCAVCLEIPKEKPNLQVRICEKGHHFCSPCHKKLRKCAICRGRLFIGRNFVVEELITKLGPHLGVTKFKLPPPESPPKYSSGRFRCLHQCKAKLPAGKLLPHIRKSHSKNLIDNMRSNPFSGHFDYMFAINFEPKSCYTFSSQISDMGLFTVVVRFDETHFYAYIQALGDETTASLFKYQITARITRENDTYYDFAVSDCITSSYSSNVEDIIESGNLLKIEIKVLFEFLKGKKSFNILYSIGKSTGKKVEKDFDLQKLAPEVPTAFPNDRILRRTRNRNARRKKLKARLKSLAQEKKITDEDLLNLGNGVRSLYIDSDSDSDLSFYIGLF